MSKLTKVFIVLSAVVVFAASSVYWCAPAVKGMFDEQITFSERVRYERKLQEIYFKLRRQSSENKESFETVLPLAASQGRVAEILRKSNALEQISGVKITPEMLQTEINRMSRETRQPEVLREIFAAFEDNPYIIAEVLARSNLVDRLTAENAYFNERWQWEKDLFAAEIAEIDFAFRLDGIAPNPSTTQPDDTWKPMPVLPENTRPRTAVWTGAEMLVWGGGPETFSLKYNSGSRYNPATDIWLPITGYNAPVPRSAHTAVWTGTEMIVFGGCGRTSNFCSENSGGRYNPATDSWAPTSTANAPTPRYRHEAIWTGNRMIVWGGCRQTTTDSCQTSPLPTGGMYSPATDTWTTVSTADVGQIRHSLVWTGSEMIVFGGYGANGNFKLGGRFNPNTNSWALLNPTGAPFPRLDHTAVWTGSEMIVWGGVNAASERQNTGARYNPANDTWTPVSTTNAPSPRTAHTAIWTGTEMIIWGGLGTNNLDLNTGGRYNPATDTWTPTNTANAPSARSDHVAVWTGTEMIIWGAAGITGGRYNPATDSWLATSTNDAPPNRSGSEGVWTGAEMIIFGGEIGNTGAKYNPATAVWTPIRPLNEIPVRNSGFTLVWTGSEMIVWGGGITVLWDDGARYNPSTDTWTVLSQTNAPSERTRHSAVWTGSEMMIWGGQANNGKTNTGGRYNPTTNSWTSVSTINAPEGRDSHTAVVVGNQMIVWGGINSSSQILNTGGRYNLTNHSWLPTSTANAPSARYFHTAISTGTEMIVWGGRFTNVDTDSGLNTGGRYNPATDVWTATSAANAPSPRSRHTAVWTGSEMIIYAGNAPHFTDFLNTGGRYKPAADSWRAVSLFRVGTERADHIAVWTGKSMLVWGGTYQDGDTRAGYEYFASGGGRTRFDFDGDNKADISVYRPSEGVWYLLQSTQGFSAARWGTSTDKIMPADYDGDGKTDLTVFRRDENSTWYILNSSSNTIRIEQWGATNFEQQLLLFDTAVPADYDGDGKADLAVWRLTDHIGEPARFLIKQSSNNSARTEQWGNSSDRPVPADFDGDGKADLAIYRGGTWWILQSTDNSVRATQFGLSQDKIVPADYDGDGKADLAVYRGGTWYLLQSKEGFSTFQFGLADDVPAPADYDGDGRTDAAVFRNGTWYLLQSGGGISIVQFGLAADIPIASAFVR